MPRSPAGPSVRFLIAAAGLGCALLAGLHAWGIGLPSSREVYEAVVKGSFRAGTGIAEVQGERIPYWSSEAAGAPSQGSVALGAFPAPDHLRYALRGHPQAPGNQLFLELELTGIRLPLEARAAGQGWSVVDVDLPLGWRGWRVTFNAVAASSGPSGGFSVTQPFGMLTGGARRYGLLETLSAWLANGLLYGALFVGAATVLARRTSMQSGWIALLAGALVACLGYLAFWAYFLSAGAGKAYSLVVFVAVAAAALTSRARLDERDREWVLAGMLAALVGLFYIGVLHLYPSARDFYQLAANRFLVSYPGDNRLPFDFANLLYHGQRPRELGAGWLSSDRPPLQEGWQLLAWPLTAVMGFRDQTASGTAAIWLQLLWVPALFGLLRSLGLSLRRSLAWTAVLSLNGFFLLHTVYTWPKLAAGAFVCAAFSLWVFGRRPLGKAEAATGGLLAALGWLAHGGIAFSLIGLSPWVAWRCVKGESSRWLVAGLVFLAAALPWFAYQKGFAPPGDRLLKWHLAGQTEVDPRPLGTLLSEAYGRLSWPEIVRRKAANALFQFEGDWIRSAGYGSAGVTERRVFEVDHLARTIGPWALGLPFLAFALARWRRSPTQGDGRLAALALWIALSCLAWWVLLFDTAIVPQGPFSMVMSLFALCSVVLERFGRGWLIALGVVQAYGFAVTWMPASSAVSGSPSLAAATLIAAAWALLAWLLSRSAYASGPAAATASL